MILNLHLLILELKRRGGFIFYKIRRKTYFLVEIQNRHFLCRNDDFDICFGSVIFLFQNGDNLIR